MAEPRLTYGGRLIGTIAHAARRHRITANAMHKAVDRMPDVQQIMVEEQGELVPLISNRTPVYYLTEIDKGMGTRPGKGSNLRGPRT